MSNNKSVFVGVDKNSHKRYASDLASLEHEIIHSEQNARYKNMPIELEEYEAYVANLSPAFIKEYPNEIESIVFEYFIGGSVRNYYKRSNEEAKSKSLPELVPVWKDPEFFLKNIDHIEQLDIDEYKKKLKDLIKS